MSRVGKKPIAVPADVVVTIDSQNIKIKGKHGELSLVAHSIVAVSWDVGTRTIQVTRPNDNRQSRALHGLTRALVNNMVVGVTTPFEKKLEIQGVGYQASLKDKVLTLQVGFANAIKLPVPAGVVCEVPDNTHINLRGVDKQAVGQFAAEIRSVRPPEPYKGKGIRYQNERVRKKAGKAMGS